MTWRIVGETCSEPDCIAPVFEAGRCRRHWDLAMAFGYSGEPEPELAPLESLALDHRSCEFSRQLNAWRRAA